MNQFFYPIFKVFSFILVICSNFLRNITRLLSFHSSPSIVFWASSSEFIIQMNKWFKKRVPKHVWYANFPYLFLHFSKYYIVLLPVMHHLFLCTHQKQQWTCFNPFGKIFIQFVSKYFLLLSTMKISNVASIRRRDEGTYEQKSVITFFCFSAYKIWSGL